jgi:putative hydrolase of the HAD superfamily
MTRELHDRETDRVKTGSRPQNPVRAVVFDAVGTIITPNSPVSTVYQTAIEKHCGIRHTTDFLGTALRNALTRRSRQTSLQTNEVTEHRFWEELIRDLCNGHPQTEACFDDLYEQFGQPQNWSVFDDVADCLIDLQAHDLSLAVASNFDHRLHSVLNGLSEVKSLTTRFVSSEIGFRKPAAQFFSAVCQQLGFPPAEVLFVGDDLTNDIQGATDTGCSAVWIDRRQQLCPESVRRVARLTEVAALLGSHSGVET